jgi:hypothetical protein
LCPHQRLCGRRRRGGGRLSTPEERCRQSSTDASGHYLQHGVHVAGVEQVHQRPPSPCTQQWPQTAQNGLTSMHSVRGSRMRHRAQKIFLAGKRCTTLHMPCPPQPMVRKVPGRTASPRPRSRNRAVFPGPALRHAHCELHLLTAAARQEAEAHRRVERVVKAAAQRRRMCRLRGIWRERQHQ